MTDDPACWDGRWDSERGCFEGEGWLEYGHIDYKVVYSNHFQCKVTKHVCHHWVSLFYPGVSFIVVHAWLRIPDALIATNRMPEDSWSHDIKLASDLIWHHMMLDWMYWIWYQIGFDLISDWTIQIGIWSDLISHDVRSDWSYLILNGIRSDLMWSNIVWYQIDIRSDKSDLVSYKSNTSLHTYLIFD